MDAIFEGNHPLAFCTDDMDFDVERPWLLETSILRRLDAAVVEVDVKGIPVKMRCTVGTAETGQSVLVRTQDGASPYTQQARARLVGPLELPTPGALEAGRLTVGRPAPVCIERIDTNKTITGRTETGQRVRVHRSFGVEPRVAHWYAAVPVASTGEGTRSGPSLQLVSTELIGI